MVITDKFYPSHRVLGAHRVLGIDPLDQRVPDEGSHVSASLIQGLRIIWALSDNKYIIYNMYNYVY
jgi:hypothetical protein